MSSPLAPPARPPLRGAHAASCTGCGAPVPISGASEVVPCGYCGHRVFIEPNLRKHHDRALAALSVEREARAALASALQAESRARARNRIALIAAVVGAPAGVTGAIVHFAGDALEAWLTLVLQVLTLAATLVAVLAGGVAALFLLNPRKIAESAALDLERFTSGIRARPLASRCPHCGAPIETGAVMRTLQCSHCRTELLIAEGVAIRWTYDARAREAQWKTEAERALTYADFDFANRWVMWYALVFIAACGYNALLAVMSAVRTWLLG